MQTTLDATSENGNLTPAKSSNACVSLDAPGVAKALSARIKYDIDEYAISNYYDPHRWHLGASLIGHECSRYLWFLFRWCGRQVGSGRNDTERHENLGRMQRLFNRGHREEDRYTEFLKGIGCQVWTHDEQGNQFRMSAVNGHYGGSIDGVVRFPARYGVADPVLVEFKTNNTGHGWNELLEKGLAVSKPQHFIQASSYGFQYKLQHGCYFNTNKNDDDLHVELVRLNWDMAQQFIAKAERIILSPDPPPRIAEQPTYFKCKMCDMAGVCHSGKLPERNCRSCKHAKPAEAGEWHCSVHNGIIPRDFVKTGCPSYLPLVNA